jgi:thioredoxin-related protein
MEEESFTQPEIRDYLTRHFIVIRVDIDKEKKTASSYFVRALPTSWFLEPDGSKITSIPGYTYPNIFLSVMKYVTSEAHKEMTLQEYIRSQKQ